MISAKVSFVVILLVCFSVSSYCQCPARDCDVTSWTFWSRCTSDQCGQLGAQSRSRMIVTRPTCGGRECPDNLFETRQCYGGNPVDCELSEWTSWSSCTTPCGASGTQSSSRHRVLTEKCGGTCSSSLSRTRSCLQTSCFNGGSVQNGACRCRDGFTGNCCQEEICNGPSPAVDCQLSSWSEWSHCTTDCGVGGLQTRTRQRTIYERCGGSCSGGSDLKMERSCSRKTCFNGGSLMGGACSCKEGYTGYCCEKNEDEETDTGSFSVTLGVSLSGGFSLLFFCLCGYCCYRCFCKN